MPLNYLTANSTHSYRKDYSSECHKFKSLEYNFLIRNYADHTITMIAWKAIQNLFNNEKIIIDITYEHDYVFVLSHPSLGVLYLSWDK